MSPNGESAIPTGYKSKTICSSGERRILSRGGGGLTLHDRCCARPEKADERGWRGDSVTFSPHARHEKADWGGGHSDTFFPLPKKCLGQFSRHGVGVPIVHHQPLTSKTKTSDPGGGGGCYSSKYPKTPAIFYIFKIQKGGGNPPPPPPPPTYVPDLF